MISERAWVSRLIAALGGLGAAGLLPSSCVLGQSSCPGTEPDWQTACFTKPELAASERTGAGGSVGEAGAGGSGALDSCPALEEIQTYSIANDRFGGASLDSVQEQGESCCYRYSYPCEGRPLLAADELVVAATLERIDWVRSQFSPPPALDEKTRAALARAWARDAAFEHASIASFSQFVMELLSLGAPLELLRDAQRAVQDEIRHAELCYALASRYAGKKLGPGPLSVPAFAARSLREVALAALREGCISETIAAHAARERLAGASDPVVVAVLERIVEDEQRHAELSFRFLNWALERDPGLAGEADRAFAMAAVAAEAIEDDPELPCEIQRAHGVATAAARRASAKRALSQVIAPCHRALRGRLRAS